MPVTISPPPPLGNDWRSAFGVSRDAVLQSLQGDDGWLDRIAERKPALFPKGDSFTRITEMAFFQFEIATVTVRPQSWDDIEDHPNLVAHIHLDFSGVKRGGHAYREVYIKPRMQGCGIGHDVIHHAIPTVQLLGGKGWVGDSEKMGPEFWLRNGSVSANYPGVNDNNSEFDRRIRRILDKPEHRPGWGEEDVKWLQELHAYKQAHRLGEIAARDLWVFNKKGHLERFGKYALNYMYLGRNSFTFDNAWTISRLRSQVGYDPVTRKPVENFQGPTRPGPPAAIAALQTADAT